MIVKELRSFLMNTKRKGIIFTMIATILFGVTPAIGKMTYAMGNNGI